MNRDKIRAEAYRDVAAVIEQKAAMYHRNKMTGPGAWLDHLVHEIRMMTAPDFWPSYVKENDSNYFKKLREKRMSDCEEE